MPFNRMIACATMASALVLAAASAEARPKTVDGPGYLPECFAAWDENTQHFQWPGKEGPFKVAVVNGSR